MVGSDTTKFGPGQILIETYRPAGYDHAYGYNMKIIHMKTGLTVNRHGHIWTKLRVDLEEELALLVALKEK